MKRPFPDLTPEQENQLIATIAQAGGCIAITALAAVALFYTAQRSANDPWPTTYIAFGILVLMGVVLTGFAGMLIKRTMKGSILGNTFEVSDQAERGEP